MTMVMWRQVGVRNDVGRCTYVLCARKRGEQKQRDSERELRTEVMNIRVCEAR